MEPSLKDWVSAARLRTLPLALSSIVMGGFLAAKENSFNETVFTFACLTTILLQVLSNFANDYGDTQNGADQTGRIGPERAVQTGKISPKQMFKGIITVGIASLLSGLTLIYLAFGGFESTFFWIFLGIGLLSILAAYTYTAGSKPYGYVGLGDVSVFVFFGIVGVVGSYFLQTESLNSLVFWPGIMCGALATGVLNINNIRDINSDKIAGKITIPVRLGREKSIGYHWFILLISVISTLAFMASVQNTKPLYILSFLLIMLNGYQVYKAENPDPYLKTLALTSLTHVILVGFSII